MNTYIVMPSKKGLSLCSRVSMDECQHSWKLVERLASTWKSKFSFLSLDTTYCPFAMKNKKKT